MGLRFRVDVPIAVSGRRPIRPDIAFTRARVAVFVDGCFWHGCPEHGSTPKANSSYWVPKIAKTRRRDAEADKLLRDAGWTVIRFWEHTQPAEAAAAVNQWLNVPARRGRSVGDT
jgi:DNA mismatch endonuclease, patch repair protein